VNEVNDADFEAVVLKSSKPILREGCIKASSVMHVMKGAGLTVDGFYAHYDSKEDLFVETLRYAASANWSHLLESAKGDTPRSRTLSVIRQCLSRSIMTIRKRAACCPPRRQRLQGKASHIGARSKSSCPISLVHSQRCMRVAVRVVKSVGTDYSDVSRAVIIVRGSWDAAQ